MAVVSVSLVVLALVQGEILGLEHISLSTIKNIYYFILLRLRNIMEYTYNFLTEVWTDENGKVLNFKVLKK